MEVVVYKKISVPLILALVATLLFSNVAYAAPSAPDASSARRIGTVTSVNTADNTFKLSTTRNGHPTIHVDLNTIFRGLVSSLAGLEPSMYVNVQVKQISGGEYLAVVVNALRRTVTGHISGSVTGIHTTSFDILGSDGITYTFDVTSKTTFSGLGVVDFDGLALGMKVKVAYTNMGNGILRATNVVVTKVSLKVSGSVTAKDSSSFTILGTDGITYVFQVTTKTVFSGRNVTKFDQLKVGYTVRVSYALLTDGTRRAINVVIRQR
jgi:Domain of unknown function (DUF5666)